MGKRKPLTYEEAGINHDGSLDPFKVDCGRRAFETRFNAERLGVHFEEWTYGESAAAVMLKLQLSKLAAMKIAIGTVGEGVGTKNLASDPLHELTGSWFYDHFAQDNVAMSANDLVTLGISPAVFMLHVAAGDGEWFANKKRAAELIRGTGNACDLAGCVWGGGETPALPKMVYPDTVLLAGSMWGVPINGSLLNPKSIRSGDAIIGLESSGVHANGQSLTRKIAEEELPDGYATLLSDGRTYGEAMAEKTHLYCDIVEEAIRNGIEIHYCVNVTGHGWRKLMRAPQPFRYVVEQLPTPQPIFEYIEGENLVSTLECYRTFNMGLGFALYMPQLSVPDFLRLAKKYDIRFRAFEAGRVEKAKEKRVVIVPKNIRFGPKDLRVRRK